MPTPRFDSNDLVALLERVRAGETSPAEAAERLRLQPLEQGIADLGFARVDTNRALRRGFPEVIFAEGKTPEQVATIFATLAAGGGNVLATRVNDEQVTATRAALEGANVEHDALGRTLALQVRPFEDRGRGKVLVVCAGTTDLPVAREALVTCELMGNRCELVADVGVTGLHRILGVLDELRSAEVLIVVAGMEAALGSVAAGLVEAPVVAVPTSVGYGIGAGGIPALLGLLSSCAPGVTVVNIDNGFGAGYAAALMNRRRAPTPAEP